MRYSSVSVVIGLGQVAWATSIGLAGLVERHVQQAVRRGPGAVRDWRTAGAALVGTTLYLASAVSPVPVNPLGPVVLAGADPAAA